MPMCFFFFNDTATTEIYTLSLHDALPILSAKRLRGLPSGRTTLVISTPPSARRTLKLVPNNPNRDYQGGTDRKSTRLNSSHANISYAVFCLKKKKSEGSGPAFTGRCCTSH